MSQVQITSTDYHAMSPAQKAVATRRARLAAVAKSGEPTTQTAGQKAAATRAANGNATPEVLTFTVKGMDSAKAVRKVDADGDVSWHLLVHGAYRGEVNEIVEGRWAAATSTAQIGDRFESRQAAFARLVANVKNAEKVGAQVAASKVRVTCPKGHGALLVMKGTSDLYCPSQAHIAAAKARVGQMVVRAGVFTMVEGALVELTKRVAAAA